MWADEKDIGWAQNIVPVIIKLNDPHLFSYQKQYPLKLKVKEGLKHIIENLKEQQLLILFNSPCNTHILGVKKSSDKWRLVWDIWIMCLILLIYCLKFLNEPNIFQSLIWRILSRVKPVLNHPLPMTLRQLRGYLGVIGYCHIWIPVYGEFAGPYINL